MVPLHLKWRREDGLSCRHGVKPPLTHSLTHSPKMVLRVLTSSSYFHSYSNVRLVRIPIIHHDTSQSTEVMYYGSVPSNNTLCRACITLADSGRQEFFVNFFSRSIILDLSASYWQFLSASLGTFSQTGANYNMNVSGHGVNLSILSFWS